MRKLSRVLLLATPLAAVALIVTSLATRSRADEGPSDETATLGARTSHYKYGDEAFPRGHHYLLPHPDGEVVTYGTPQTEAYEQPIKYSHKMHAGDLELQCEYCHSGARRSQHAGVPSTKVCMNCHAMISPEQGKDGPREELKKLKDYYDSGKPIPWVRVHDLPDYVYFTHKRHVLAGIKCQDCHGEVQRDFDANMRVATLQMGWCLDCHDTHESVDENYGAQAELRRAELKDCWTCHK